MGVLLSPHAAAFLSDRKPEMRSILLRIAVAMAAAFTYGVAGFWLDGTRVQASTFSWSDSIERTLRYLTLVGDPTLAPRTQAPGMVSGFTLSGDGSGGGYLRGRLSVFRPILYRFRTLFILSGHLHSKSFPGAAVRHSITSKAGRTNPGSSTRRVTVSSAAYGVGANFALALGHTVGPVEEIEAAIVEFRRYCEDNGWGVGFHQTLPDFLPLYQRHGFKKLKIGDDALMDLTNFNLDGQEAKRFGRRSIKWRGLALHVAICAARACRRSWRG